MTKQDALNALSLELSWAEEKVSHYIKYKGTDLQHMFSNNHAYYYGQVTILKHLIKLFTEGWEK